jgi:two-component system sensor histidine kinase/response regulator
MGPQTDSCEASVRLPKVITLWIAVSLLLASAAIAGWWAHDERAVASLLLGVVAMSIIHACSPRCTRAQLEELCAQLQEIAGRGQYDGKLEARIGRAGAQEPAAALRPLLQAVRDSMREHEAAKGDLERRVAERTTELQRRNAELAAVRESSLDCIIMMDQHGTITEFNAAAERTFGYARGDVIGKILGDVLVPPALRESHTLRFGEFIDAGACATVPERLEVAALRSDGTEFPVELALSMVRLQGPPMLVAYLRDITQLKRAQADAKYAEKLALVASRTDNAVIISDVDGNIEWVNEGFIRITGRTLAEVAGRKPGSFLQGPETDPATVLYMREKLRQGEGFQTEIVNYSKDGRKYWLAASIQPIHDAVGKLTNFIAIESDITERKRAERALLEAEEKYRSIFENAVHGIFQTTLAGQFLSSNSALARIYGYDSAEQLRATVTDIGSQLYVDPMRWEDFIRLMGANGRVSQFESQIYRKDGTIRWISEEARAVTDENGKMQYFEGIIADVTDRRRAEEQLRHAKLDAQAANRAKSEFLAAMSHEIRTPLNGVIGMTELLLDSDIPPHQRRYAQIAKSSADALLVVINQILDFSKIESGKLELEEIDFDLRNLVEEVVEMLAARASAKGVELSCRIDPALPARHRGDPARLRQVLVNLANNAVKFTERGEVAIGVERAAEIDGRLALRFSVRDTGLGIPADRIDRLFLPFSQIDPSTTRKYGGTGLGLAISKQIVEAIGGKIEVQSEPNVGSTFSFTAPLGASTSTDTVESAPLVDLRGVRVVVADDSATPREALCEQLTAWGMRATPVAGGAEAMQRLREAAAAGDPYRMAMIDMLMPGTDSAVFAREMRSDVALRGTALVLMTSLETPLEAERAREAGYSDLVTKPLRQSQLLDTVMRQVAGKKLSETRTVVAAQSGQPRSEARILVAEDNEVNQFVARELLARAGYACDVVGDGEKAVEAVTTGAYDLVLMDCQMPLMDGFGAAMEIRRREAGASASPRHVPIVALTANAVKGDREHCIECGMDDYLSKPLDSRQLIATIKRILTQGQQPVAEGDASGLTPVPANPAAAPPIDMTSLQDRCLGDSDFAMQMLSLFAEQAPRQVAALGASIVEADAKLVSRLAHGLKGSAANLSANTMSAQASKLEEMGRDAMLDGAQQTMELLQAELQRCIEFIREYTEHAPAVVSSTAPKAK